MMRPRGNFGPRKRPDPRRPSLPPSPAATASSSAAEERLGRFLAFVLRHHPEKLGLTLDNQGAADMELLAKALQKRSSFKDATRKQIERMATSTTSAHRFEVLGDRIRARYGHSLPQAIELEPAAPPPVLYFSTTREDATTISKAGLQRGQRQRVHLSTTLAAARIVGIRRTPTPILLKVDTVRASGAGVKFYKGGPAVWLSDDIPADCISSAE
jgi:putative RNA 2'-phosphotransferase